jgi:hypothetical protein
LFDIRWLIVAEFMGVYLELVFTPPGVDSTKNGK